jgi:proclavaminate amidinohydrolase
MQPAVSQTPWPVTAAPRRTTDEHRRTGNPHGMPAASSPRYAQAATFMRLPPVLAPTGRDAVVIGAPYDGGTGYRPGARLAPRAIRHESCLIGGTGGSNVFDEIFDAIDVVDGADIDLGPLPWEPAMAKATTALSGLLRDNDVFLMLGGDHSMSLPGIRAAHERHGQLAVLHLDAHSDTLPAAFGGPYHGMPFRQGLEDGLIHGTSMIQIGIRQQDQGWPGLSRGHEVTVITALGCAGERGVGQARDRIREVVGERPLYVSVDVAVADPAFAPGSAMPAPGGLPCLDVLTLLDVVGELNPVGFDVVGVCPPFDPSGITALLAAEIGAKLLCQYSRSRRGYSHQRTPTVRPPDRKGNK